MSHKKWTIQSTVLVTLLLLAVVTAQAGSPVAPAAPAVPPGMHIVDSDGDEGDANPGDGVCETGAGNRVCTLRAAIEEANARTGADEIRFDSLIGTITPKSELPIILDDRTTIRGRPTSITGDLTEDAYGLQVASDYNKLQSLIITNFDAGGVLVEGNRNYIGTDSDGENDDNEGNVISANGWFGVCIYGDATLNRLAGNLIGLTPDGTGADGNAYAGVSILTSASGDPHLNVIGTNGNGISDKWERNVISGNGGHGVHITGADENIIAGNFIGTNAAGDAAIPNTLSGVVITAGVDNRIGTDGKGTENKRERNVISGNDGHGVHISGAGVDHNVVAGNYIGTNKVGDAAIPNTLSGVMIHGGAHNRIGTDGDGTEDRWERNVISGNKFGVHISGVGADHNVVAGNYIGTNKAGDAAIPNDLPGVRIDDGAAHNIIGTDGSGTADEAERNVISGNNGVGVVINGDGTDDNVVAGNYIGTNKAGDAAIRNDGSGVYIIDSDNNRIGTNGDGTSDDLERNVISGHTNGIRFSGHVEQTVVAGNYIGTDASGTGNLGNGTGVILIGHAINNTIGGTASGAANRIAFNNNDGIWVVESTSGDTPYNNNLRGNVIFANGGLGIDLHPNGVAPNDTGDGDYGPNHLQNYPVLSSATIDRYMLVIQGTLNSSPNTTYHLDFYANSGCDPSGYGEGKVHRGTTTVTTNGSGNASFTATFLGSTLGGHQITATATDPDGNTSEFSQCLTIGGTPDIYVTPPTLDATLPYGGTAARALNAMLPSGSTTTRTLTISNTGTADLMWSLAESPAVGWINEVPAEGTIAPGGSTDVTVSFDTAIPTGVLSPGTYSTTLRITSNDPDEATVDVSTTLTVTEPCAPITGASFAYIPPSPQAGQPVAFDGNVTPSESTPPITYAWDWGDGSPVQTGDPAIHTFAIAGTYSVVMTATNGCGQATATQDVTISGTPDIDVSPLALSTTLNPEDTANRTLTIGNTGTADLTWSLAENPAVGWLNEAPTGGTVAPAGSTDVAVGFDAAGLSPGTYNTTLRIVSNDPDEATLPSPLEVPVSLIVVTNCVPIAGVDFTVAPTPPVEGQAATFTATFAQGSESDLAYAWDFGDGSALGQTNPISHTYAVHGTYAVTLTVANSCGQATATQEVSVSGIPDIDVSPLALGASLNPDATANRTLTIGNTGTADLMWLLAESPAVGWLSEAPVGGVVAPAGSTDVTVSFDAAGLSPGTYNTTLHVTSDDPDEATVDVSVVLTVAAGCIPIAGADFDVAPTPLVEGQAATFTATFAQGSESGLAYTWDFGDGSALGQTNPISHTYAVHGTYAVTLTVENTCGTDEVVHTLVVEAAPEDYLLYLPLVIRNYD